MNVEKSVVLFTSFWDANYIIGNRYFLFEHNKKAYKVTFEVATKKDECNFSVHSIALKNPDLKKMPALTDITTLDFFCPTYDMLNRYKNNADWDSYRNDFYTLMGKRQDKLANWLESLIPEHIYILCCWENTSERVYCHRKILYDIMCKSKSALKKVIPVYRDGGKKENEIHRQDYPAYGNVWEVYPAPITLASRGSFFVHPTSSTDEPF